MPGGGSGEPSEYRERPPVAGCVLARLRRACVWRPSLVTGRKDAPTLLLLCRRSSWQTFALPMIRYVLLANPVPGDTAMSQLGLAFSLLIPEQRRCRHPRHPAENIMANGSSPPQLRSAVW